MSPRSIFRLWCCLFLFPAALRVTAAVTLKEALDGDGLLWSSTGQAQWVPLSNGQQSHDGVDMVSVATGASGELNSFVTGGGVLRWWWKVEGMAEGGRIEFVLDELRRQKVEAAIGWTEAVLVIPDDVHTLSWRVKG
ncbi:MAG TPA: hypothetical protein VHM91_20560, partial [Verrucomicrobiales bacterium]|nr:hypothetical protein [Verrucomicrobiales bacterium]